MSTSKVEVLADYTSSHGPQVAQIRGALIVSSLQALRELGFIERYLRELPGEKKDTVLFVLASSWIPVEVAMAHYGACNAMNLSDEELDRLGDHVSRRIVGTFLGTLVRSSQRVAVPDVAALLRQYARLWERLMLGGSCRVLATGLKDARIESYGMPMFRYRYFRVAYMGLIRGAGLLFRSALFTRQRKASDDSLTIDVSWV